MKKTRLTALLLSLVMLIALLPLGQASAAGYPIPALSVQNATLNAGDTLKVDWVVNWPGATAVQAAQLLLAPKNIDFVFSDYNKNANPAVTQVKNGANSGTASWKLPAGAPGFVTVYLSFWFNGNYYEDSIKDISVDGWVGNTYFKAGDFVKKGWVETKGDWYYLDATGNMLLGKNTIDKKTYYFSGDPATFGVMQIGWVQIAGNWYFFGSDGAMKTNWIKDSGSWYWMDSDGSMRLGWAKVDGSWYFLSGDPAYGLGKMVTGWMKRDGNWYLFSSSGAMQTGWTKSGGNWYYMFSDGIMASDYWDLQNGTWYYLRANGVMATNTQNVPGYRFDANGAFIGN